MAHTHMHAGAHPSGVPRGRGADKGRRADVSAKAFALGIVLNGAFVAVEFSFGVLARSTALVADAAHNLTDVLALGVGWGATLLARRPPSLRRTYGFRRTTILAALSNAVALFIVLGGIVWEAIGRLRNPEPVAGRTVLAVAAAGVLVNGLSALLFFSGRKRDANARAAFLHLAADAAVSLAVVFAGVLMITTGWARIDPIVGLLVSVAILVGAWSLLRESLDLALDAVPPHVDPDAVREYLAHLPGVLEVHDLHIWGMSTTESALTAHLVMPGDSCHPAFVHDVCRALHDAYAIEHATIQVEAPDAPDVCSSVTSNGCN